MIRISRTELFLCQSTGQKRVDSPKDSQAKGGNTPIGALDPNIWDSAILTEAFLVNASYSKIPAFSGFGPKSGISKTKGIPQLFFFSALNFIWNKKEFFSANLTIYELIKLVPTDQRKRKYSSAVVFRNRNKYWIMEQAKPARKSTYFQNEKLN